MNSLELAVRARWKLLPWGSYGICAGCGENRYRRGKNKAKLRCLECYGQEEG